MAVFLLVSYGNQQHIWWCCCSRLHNLWPHSRMWYVWETLASCCGPLRGPLLENISILLQWCIIHWSLITCILLSIVILLHVSYCALVSCYMHSVVHWYLITCILLCKSWCKHCVPWIPHVIEYHWSALYSAGKVSISTGCITSTKYHTLWTRTHTHKPTCAHCTHTFILTHTYNHRHKERDGGTFTHGAFI